jgi:choline/glycine/proline betaine transport protein
MLLVCHGLLKGLRLEGTRRVVSEPWAGLHIRAAQVPWQKRLGYMLSWPKRAEVEAFLRDTVRPALEEFAAEVRGTGLNAVVDAGEDEVALSVLHGSAPTFSYPVRLRSYTTPSFAFPEFDPHVTGLVSCPLPT